MTESAKAGYKLKTGDYIEISIPEPRQMEVRAEDIPLDIIHEDNDIIVINKPRGMVVHPAAGNYSGTLVNALLKHCSGSCQISTVSSARYSAQDRQGYYRCAGSRKNNNAHALLSRKLKEHDVKGSILLLSKV